MDDDDDDDDELPPDIRPPETLADALGFAISDGGRNIIFIGAQIAGMRKAGNMRARDLFVAALVIGQQPPKDDDTADTWLYDWLTSRVGRNKVDDFITEQAPNIQRPRSSALRGLPPVMGLTSHARALLGRARAMAQITIGENRYGVRHILAAMILPDPHMCNVNIHTVARESFELDLIDAKEMILSRVAVGGEPVEFVEAWRRMSANPPSSPSVTEGDSTGDQPSNTSPGFTPDNLATGDTDPLGINADVRAFARLICLEEATPPLSICLFGEWGSGKSTFMERLQHEVTRLCRPDPDRTADSGKAEGAKPLQFVENIVQIRFNAWHFADANLWASLTAVFFDQLRRGGYDGGRAADYKALIGKVADRVRSLEAGALQAEKQVEDAKRKSDAAQKALIPQRRGSRPATLRSRQSS